jgi:uncharacterized membrane protein HdeD (DUF308 family)
MLELLSKHWWVFVVRGVLAILFGLGTFLVPGVTLAVLVLLYGAYALADGIMTTIAAFGPRTTTAGFPWSVLLVGMIGILAGIVTFMYPGLTALVLLYLIAAWNILRGVFEIIVAVALRKEIIGEGWLILGGIGSVAFGVLLYLMPGAGALALLWLIGGFAMAFGILMIALGLKLRTFVPVRA